MTKQDFFKILLEEGYTCEKNGAYPSVVCDAKDIKKIAKDVKAIAKKNEYVESFAVKCFREGMELVSKHGAVHKDVVSEENNDEEPTASISEVIPMTAAVQDATA